MLCMLLQFSRRRRRRCCCRYEVNQLELMLSMGSFATCAVYALACLTPLCCCCCCCCRYEVNRLELMLSMGSFAAALGAMIAGIFGMNMRSSLEASLWCATKQQEASGGRG